MTLGQVATLLSCYRLVEYRRQAEWRLLLVLHGKVLPSSAEVQQVAQLLSVRATVFRWQRRYSRRSNRPIVQQGAAKGKG